jgi:hypothetical protein
VQQFGEEETKAMEPFVERKMKEPKKRILVYWDPKDTKEHFSKALFD